jgi:hypothetical protein
MTSSTRHLFRWTLALIIGVGMASPLSALADPKRISRGDLPDAARATLNPHTRVATDVVYYADDNAFWANYTIASGLRLETRVRYNGEVIETTPTKTQPKFSREQVKVEFQRYRDERRRRGDDRDPRDEQRQQQIRRLKEAETRGADLRDFRDFGMVSQVFTATTYGRVDFTGLPREVRRTLENERVDPGSERAGAPRYYHAEQGGRAFYGVHYTNRDGRRLELTLNDAGRVIDRIDLAERLVTRDRDWRDVGRWHPDDLRDRDWDRDRYVGGRDWVGDGTEDRGLLFHRVRFDDLPRAVRDTMTRFTKDAEDLFYQQQRRDGRTYYSVHYTPRDGRRVYVRLDEQGHVVRGPELSDYQPRYTR